MAPPHHHHLVTPKGSRIQCLCEPHNGTFQETSTTNCNKPTAKKNFGYGLDSQLELCCKKTLNRVSEAFVSFISFIQGLGLSFRLSSRSVCLLMFSIKVGGLRHYKAKSGTSKVRSNRNSTKKHSYHASASNLTPPSSWHLQTNPNTFTTELVEVKHANHFLSSEDTVVRQKQ